MILLHFTYYYGQPSTFSYLYYNKGLLVCTELVVFKYGDVILA